MIIQWELNKMKARKERESELPTDTTPYEFHYQDGRIRTVAIPRGCKIILNADGTPHFMSTRIRNILKREREAMDIANKIYTKESK